MESPHVKKWWDASVVWSEAKIEEKYINYVNGFKVLSLKNKTIKKPMNAFVVECDDKPIGYIQYYSKNDFPPEQGYDVSEIPEDTIAIDWYIGELDCIGKGVGTKVLEEFLKIKSLKHKTLFVDPESENASAIKVYEKLGFEKIKTTNSGAYIGMIKKS